MPFRIDSHNGTIYTNAKIYKNYKRYGYEFSARAKLHVAHFTTESTVKIKIKILDINDLVPEFEHSVYNINVSESSTIGLPLLTLNTNYNEESLLDYSIELGNENNVFSLIKQGDSRSFLTIQRSNLNYKKKSAYDLTIRVMDRDGLYSTASILASIIPADVYSPRFTSSIYKFRIRENSEINTFVGQLQAQIPSGVNYEELNYRIVSATGSSDDKRKEFNLNYKTGNLYVATHSLDREHYDSITLYVTASVGQLVDHAIVQIDVEDANDNAPVFTRGFYEANVYQDDIYNSYLLRVEATDQDLGKNGMKNSCCFSGIFNKAIYWIGKNILMAKENDSDLNYTECFFKFV